MALAASAEAARKGAIIPILAKLRSWTAGLAVLCLASIAAPAVADHAGHYVALGDVYFQARDYAAAAREFAKAMERFPDEPIPRLANGHALFAMRSYGAAARSLREGIRLLPSWSRSGIDLRGFFSDGRVFDANLDDLAAKLGANPEDPELMFLLAYVLHFSGRCQQAQGLFLLLLEQVPGHTAAKTFVDPPISGCGRAA